MSVAPSQQAVGVAVISDGRTTAGRTSYHNYESTDCDCGENIKTGCLIVISFICCPIMSICGCCCLLMEEKSKAKTCMSTGICMGTVSFIIALIVFFATRNS